MKGMDIREGLVTINGTDIWLEYGVFLAEENRGEHENYDALLKAPRLKEPRKVTYRDRNGVRLPAKLPRYWEERTLTLRFALVAADATAFEAAYYGFVTFLKEGDDGWLVLKVRELGRTFRLYLTEFSDYSQLTDFDGRVVALFTATFAEPEPDFAPPEPPVE